VVVNPFGLPPTYHLSEDEVALLDTAAEAVQEAHGYLPDRSWRETVDSTMNHALAMGIKGAHSES